MTTTRSNLFSHAAIYLIARGLPGVLAFLAIPIFSRLLTPADYGRYALVVATVELLNALLFQWLRLSLVRYNAVYNNSDAIALRSTLLTTALLTNGLVTLAAAILWFLPILDQWQQPILACWLVVTVQSFYELMCEQARASLKPWRFMLLQLMRGAGFVGLGLLLVAFLDFGWWGPLLGTALGMACGALFSLGRHWSGVRLRIDRLILRRLAQYGLPLSMTVAMAVVIATSDRYLITWFMSEAAAGVYAVACDFTQQTLTLLLLSINMAAMPLAIRAYEADGPDAARQQMSTNASLLLAVGVPAVVGIGVLSVSIAENLFGAEFRAAAITIMPAVAIATFLAGFKAFHFDAAFQFAHRTIHQVWIVLAAAIVNIGLNILFIPRWGLQGAVFASVLAYILSIGLTIYFGRRHFVLPFPKAAALQVLIAAAVMGAVLWPLRQHISPAALAAQVAVGATVYGASLIGMNFLGLRDALLSRLGNRTQAASLPAATCPLPAE